MRNDKGFTLIELMIVVGIIAILAAIAIPGMLMALRSSNERNASGSLKAVAAAQADFRAHDRDNNRVHDYWTGDVAGLFAIPGAAGEPIRLVDVGVALADVAPITGIQQFGERTHKAGYWYMVLNEDEQATQYYGDGTYQQVTDSSGNPVHNTSRFGLCAMPDTYGSSGKLVFILNDNGTIFARDFGTPMLNGGNNNPNLAGGFNAVWPLDVELGQMWSKLD